MIKIDVFNSQNDYAFSFKIDNVDYEQMRENHKEIENINFFDTMIIFDTILALQDFQNDIHEFRKDLKVIK